MSPEDKARVREEEAAAAAEAARIGGEVPAAGDDPAREPLVEAGGGESEGFELAEEELRENASHGNSRGFPAEDVPSPEERAGAEYGEADGIPPAGGE